MFGRPKKPRPRLFSHEVIDAQDNVIEASKKLIAVYEDSLNQYRKWYDEDKAYILILKQQNSLLKVKITLLEAMLANRTPAEESIEIGI
jgi:hypothetical protein